EESTSSAGKSPDFFNAFTQLPTKSLGIPNHLVGLRARIPMLRNQLRRLKLKFILIPHVFLYHRTVSF
ncbi:MAG: hypothetical protein ACKVIK_16125, partial [Rhodospirillales bacterium]